jgi:hypothetical protein
MAAASAQMRPGDLVLCRVNKELVPIDYELLRRGTKAFILGRDTGKGLITLVNRMRPRSIADLMKKLDHGTNRRQRRLLVQKRTKDNGFSLLRTKWAAYKQLVKVSIPLKP